MENYVDVILSDRMTGREYPGRLSASSPSRTVTATLYAPDGSVLGQTSGTGTRTMTATGPVRGAYRLVMTGTGGAYTATVQHLP